MSEPRSLDTDAWLFPLIASIGAAVLALTMAVARSFVGYQTADWLALPVATSAAVIGWKWVAASSDRIRFEARFWSGFILLCNGAEFAWRALSRLAEHSKGRMQADFAICVPLICAYSVFAGLLLILWAQRVEGDESKKKRICSRADRRAKAGEWAELDSNQ